MATKKKTTKKTTKKANKTTTNKKAKKVEVEDEVEDFLADDELDDLDELDLDGDDDLDEIEDDSDISEGDELELDDLDDLDEEGEEEIEEVEVKKPAKKAKKKSNKASAKNLSTEEELEAEVLEEDATDIEIAQDDYEFDPVTSGEEVRSAVHELNQTWVKICKLIAPILRAAKKHYRGDMDNYKKWLKKYTGRGYSQTQLFLQVDNLGEEVHEKIEELDLSSMHVKALPKLSKDPAEVAEFLDKKTHEVDGKRLKTKDMTPKEFDKAVKSFKKKKHPDTKDPVEPAQHEKMARMLKKIYKFLNDNFDGFKENLAVKGTNFAELVEIEDVDTHLKTSVKILTQLSKKLDSIKKNVDKAK